MSLLSFLCLNQLSIDECTEQGKGEFTMEYKTHLPVTSDLQAELVAEYRKKKTGDKS